MNIRKMLPEDESGLKEVCFSTFYLGQDERYRELAPLKWIIPYLKYERENGFVLVNSSGKIDGYAVSAPDARDFRKRYHRRMSPSVMSELRKQRNNFSLARYLVNTFEYSYYFDLIPPGYEKAYPAHIHIDLHPRCHGGGWGTAMMNKLHEHLRGIGCPGIHLGVGLSNSGAIRFYERLGYVPLKKSKANDVLYMGKRL